MSRALRSIFAGMVLMASTAAVAADDIGVPVTVRVLDQAEQPIPTAVVRHPQEAERHRVNAATGEWTESVLYLQDGSEFIFEKGTELELEVSAPGYVTRPVKYVVRKRKNLLVVMLEQMPDLSEDMPDDVNLQFGRDHVIE